MRYKNDVIFQSMDPKEAAEFTKGDPEKIKLMREIKAQQKIEDFKAPIKQDDPMTTWVKNTTALNKNPGAFKKEVKASEAIENQPGYKIEDDPNLLRRIKFYEGKDLGPAFDAAIAEEDKALKKLGRDPMNILQRNKSKKAVAVKPKVKPFVKKPKQLELPLNIPKIDFNLLKSPVAPDAGSMKQEPVTTKTRIEDDPKYRNTIFGTDVLYRRKRGLDD